MKKKRQIPASPCPCRSGKTYTACCMQWHQGSSYLQAPDAQTLMRSRYTAYVMGLNNYLLETWHPQTRPENLDETEPRLKWLGLHIHNDQQQSENLATVEFTARYSMNGKAYRMHEVSTFEKIDAHWYYKEGVVT